MKATAFFRPAFAVLALAVAGDPARAGIKYWDSQAYKAYDADDYVPGAVWHYDGIRNAGLDQPHSTTNLTWKNLGTGAGSEPEVYLQKFMGNSTWNSVSAAELSAGTYGEWTDDGFVFKGNDRMRRDSPGRIDTGTKYTMQLLVDANANDIPMNSALVFNSNFDNLSCLIDKATQKLRWNTKEYHGSNAAVITGPSFDYVTAIANGDTGTTVVFSGTEAPTSGDGYKKSDSIAGHSEAGYAFGSNPNGGSIFAGTLKFFRYYQKALSNEEVAWNRVVDEWRFFERNAPIPVTNVVIATAVASVEGTEPSGNYAVDGSHRFTAPATVTVGGIDYVCTGYTLETRDGEGWTEPVFHKAALFQPVTFLVTDTDCVRLTWQWAKADGLKNLGYTIDDYVWDGLEVFYDGICNQGTNVAHSTTATNWVNLGSKGNMNDMFIQRLNTAGSAWETARDLNPVGGRDPGCWTEQGFMLKGDSRFRCNSPGNFNVSTSYSLQMLVDAKTSDQGSDDLFYLLGANNDTFAFRIKSDDGNLYWRYKNNNSNMPYLSGGTYDYITAIMRAENKQTFFSGTTEPTSGNGYKTNTSYGYSDTGFCLGGYGKQDYNRLLVGTLKSFRQYDHALSAAEVAQNRAVDNWRYFGISDVTNVIVQSTVPYLRGDEPDGPYAVDGSHTFTAPASVTAKGIDYACDGYIVERWDGSAWTDATTSSTNSYTYTVGTSPERVRLTWKWRSTHGLRTAADYSFDDYSQAGLLWNYDGIRNQGGTDADHDSSATTWKNLGSGGAAYDLHWNDATPAGGWTTNGYRFEGGPRFKGDGKIGPLKNFTLQTLIDADIASQTESTSNFSYIMNAFDNYFNLSLVSSTYPGSASNSICWKAQCDANGNNATFMYFHAKDLHYDYATAIMDYDAKKAMMFPGTTIPTEYNKDGAYGAQRLYHEFASVRSVSTTGYGLGNRNNNGTEGLVGTIKSFRYYDRVLTEEELVRNRNVDAVRFFGELGVTNLVVEVAEGENYACDPAPGAYFVEGSWTFTAERISGGPMPAGYRVQDWDPVNERWTNPRGVESLSFTYDASRGVKQRIVWRSLRPFLLFVR